MGDVAGEDKETDLMVIGEPDVLDDFLDEQFSEIGEGVAVRPLLKTDDLRLMRRVFIRDIRSGFAGSDEVACRELMKRMLRFAGRRVGVDK